MSTIVLFLYSKYVPLVKPYLETIQKLDYVQTLCVDNEEIRKVVLQASLLKIKKVPCFIVIYPDNRAFQYTDIGTFLQKLIEANSPKQQKIEKSLIKNVVDTSQLNQEVYDNNNEEEDIRQTNKSYPTNSRPISKEQEYERQIDRKSNKSKIGEIINYQKEKNEKLKPESNTSSRTQIQKGNGHESMGRSSLRETSKEKAFDVIEDIDDEPSEEGLINFGGKNEEKKDKKISDIKSLVNEMSDQREEQLKLFNKNK